MLSILRDFSRSPPPRPQRADDKRRRGPVGLNVDDAHSTRPRADWRAQSESLLPDRQVEPAMFDARGNDLWRGCREDLVPPGGTGGLFCFQWASLQSASKWSVCPVVTAFPVAAEPSAPHLPEAIRVWWSPTPHQSVSQSVRLHNVRCRSTPPLH